MCIVHRCKNCRTLLCRTYPWVGGVPAGQPGRQQVVLLLGVYAGQVAVSALGPDLLPARSARLVPRRLQIFFIETVDSKYFSPRAVPGSPGACSTSPRRCPPSPRGSPRAGAAWAAARRSTCTRTCSPSRTSPAATARHLHIN